MKSHLSGLIEPEDHREMSHKLVEELLSRSPSEEFSLVVQAYWQVWKTIEAQIKKIEEKLKEQAQEDPNETIYRSAPGSGLFNLSSLASADSLREEVTSSLITI